MVRLWTVSLLFLSGAAQADTLPASFRGVWSADLETQCKATSFGVSGNHALMKVTAQREEESESACDFRSIKLTPDNPLTATISVACSSEGVESTGPEIWHVQQINGLSFLITSNQAYSEITVLRRCQDH